MTTLSDLRQHAGLTQMALASKVGGTAAQVSGWELGHVLPSTKYILPLADALGVSAEVVIKAAQESQRNATPRQPRKPAR